MSQHRRSRFRGNFLCAAAITTAAIAHFNYSSAAPLAIGAIDQIDLRNSSVVVLGQRFHVGSGTLVTSQTTYPNQVLLAAVPRNALVWVDGEENGTGATRVDALIILPESNIPGASQLLVTGVVSAVGSDGRIRVGQLNIDITATLSSGNSQISVGDLVEVFGTQPVSQNVFLAQSAARTQGVGGTGKSVVALGVGGTGANTQGVGGTGKSAVLLGVGGTGASTQGVGGTGKSVVALGVGGTGASTQGVGGTGTPRVKPSFSPHTWAVPVRIPALLS
ncbi:MAG: hypothetical protein JWN85_2544, partial [Gammaproteobacteria bacterium]|nr:hypothetical protein [Gammaproteobacteria bacterium]